jgi:serine/threonine-protein phosphatase 2A regulatory subunit B
MIFWPIYMLYSSFPPLDKTIKLWKVSERDKRAEGYNLKEDSGTIRDPTSIKALR